MKKIIAAVLTLCLCSGFVACSAEKEMKNDIVGEWIAVNNGATAVFNEDGTGVVNLRTVTWKYDSKLACYTIADQITYNAKVGMEYDLQHLQLMGSDFYRPNDYDKAFTLMLSKRQEDILNLTANMTKLQLNMAYELADNVTIEFTEIVRHMEGDGLLASYTIVNHSTEAISQELSANLQGKFYSTNSSAATISGDIIWTGALSAGDIHSDTVGLCHLENVTQIIDAHGILIGAIYFKLGETQYFINLSDWFK